jgi:hypothetical protein
MLDIGGFICYDTSTIQMGRVELKQLGVLISGFSACSKVYPEHMVIF